MIASVRKAAFVAFGLSLALLPALSGCGRSKETPAEGAGAVDPGNAAAIAFRDRVVEIVKEEFPGTVLEVSVDPQIVLRDGAEMHLGNLRARCDAAGGVESCRGVIRAHFVSLFESLAQPVGPPIGWEDAKPRLRPQLSPIDYQAQMKVIAEPFSDELIVAFVIDAPKSFRFVTEEDRARWNVPVGEIAALAMANLERASQDIPVNASEGENRLLAVEVGDGYDATRLLLPSFRAFALKELRGPYVAAVPNRDTLVMWAEDASPEFQRAVLASVEQSYRGEPYPLSLRLFHVDASGMRAVKP